jgi:uracil-DNA glycosylase family 4
MPISARESLNKLNKDISNCKKCVGPIKTQKHSMPGSGAAKAKIMVIADYPDSVETGKKGIVTGGTSRNKFIIKLFDEAGLSFNRDIYITYLIKCSAGKLSKEKNTSRTGDSKSFKKHVDNCISFLSKEISIITPHIIISLGLDVSNVILQKFFSVSKKYRNMEKIHMRIFENPSFKLVPFSDPLDIRKNGAITEEKFKKDFQSLSKLLKII